MAKLVINPTSASKKEIPIASRVISIGRDPSNDLVLSDSMVSRRHAILEQRDDIYVLRDNNSSNGTLVNGDKVDNEQTLRDGDLVAIGSSRLLFQLDEAGESARLPDAAEKEAPGAPSKQSSGDDSAAPGSASLTPSPKPAGKCPTCGKQADPRDRFCRACGAELAKKRSVTCTACGYNVPLPAEFCGRCGHELPKKSRAGLATASHDLAELELDKADKLDRGDGGKPDARPGRGAGAAARGRARPRKPGDSAKAGKAEEPAGFGVRFVAALVDTMILGVPVFMSVLLWLVLAGPSPAVPQRSVNLVSIFFSLLSLAYYVFFWGARGATPGKSLLGLVVRTEDGESPIGFGRAFLRVVGYLASSLILGLGFVMIAFSDDKRGLHDRIAGTRVTRNP